MRNQECGLPIVFGITDDGLFIKDLRQMPNLIVAGSVGQGKSVLLKGMLESLMCVRSSTELQLVLIDPKGIEFNQYKNFSKQYLSFVVEKMGIPILEDSDHCFDMLKHIKQEIDQRYVKINAAKMVNIIKYNNFVDEVVQNIVVVIDEYGDLVLAKDKSFIPLIRAIAEKGPSVGIHLIISTSRISRDIIHASLNSVIPVRVSFRVATAPESKIILGSAGAERLDRQGLMLYKDNNGIVCISNQCFCVNANSSCESLGSNAFMISKESDYDKLLGKAAIVVIKAKKCSFSIIQLELGIGFNRTGRIIEQMERLGVVGQVDRKGYRSVLINIDELPTLFKKFGLDFDV